MIVLADEMYSGSGAMSEVAEHGGHGRWRLSSPFRADAESKDSDGNSAKGGHDMGCGGITDAATILIESEVTPVM